MNEGCPLHRAHESMGEDRRQTAERLQASEESFRLMVESVKDCAVFTLDPEGRIASWNTGAQRIHGYEAKDVIGQPIAIVYVEEEVAAGKPQGDLEQAAKSGRSEQEGWRRRQDGSRFWAKVITTALRDEDGRLEGFSKMTQDMTERRTAEQALRDSAAQLQGVINTAVDGIMAIDERGIIQWLNPAALAIFGYTAEELMGQNVKILMPEPYHSEHDTYLANYIRTGQRKIIGIGREVVGRRKDGSTFPVDLAVSEVNLGHRRLFTGIVRDITQRKEAERALLAAKEAAETASRAKDHFLAVVSHELRTPLTPILATATLLQGREDLPADVKEDLGTIRRNVEHEARLVDDLLSLTRLSRGKIELHQEVVDAHASLRNVLSQFQGEIDAKGIELMMGLRAKEYNIWADPGRIQQVFSNVLENAIKFTPEGGRISLKSTNTDGKLRVEISDTGVGIEPDVLPKIFDAFEQGERTVTRKYGGLGLGLAISRGLMELHGGTLSAQSEGMGKGATFVVELNAVPAVPGRTQRKPVARQAVGAGKRILLVEDHRDTAQVMVKLLTAFGHEVTSAASVREALDLASKQPFDLLISDIGLPDGSGLDIMRNLRDRLHIQGVAVSGFGQAEDLRRSREAGFVEHLVKPVNFQMLESVVNRLSSQPAS